MKLSTNKIIFLTGLIFSFYSSFVMAEATRAGSHLESNSIPSYVVQMNTLDEVDRIRQLLTAGENRQALKAALDYIEKVEKITLVHETSRRYYAYNALCSAHTSVGETEAAIAACDTAMSLEPTKWSAVNNRGTANLIAGKLTQALEDYQLALMKAPKGNVAIAETIEHNIHLVEARR